MKVEILGVKVSKVSMKEAVDKALSFLKEDKLHMIFTPNPEMIMASRDDSQFKDIMNRADMVVPDGIGVVIGAKILGTPLIERVPGYDLVQNILKETKNQNVNFYFLGAGPGVAEKAKVAMENKYPGIQIVGVRDGYFKESDEESIIHQINEAKTDVLLVALGVPKQEKFIAKYAKQLDAKIAIGVGGSFDGMAGVVKRAPMFYQKIGLEWLYRFAKQPSRAGRMLKLPQYLLCVLISKWKRGK